ncbi:integral membrane sensor hybrid histidine kinase domain protein [Bordetella holmesii ATCC 51541]|nr:integral membrane sensor hybrid histidine kinase domain protein [Bordetella holmesii ATCC 51541]EWM47183.1 integral membrane sensor hybrid histidine kinase domain protein [Bordetella holmesii 35009]
MAKWGLRKKSFMALLLACIVMLAPAILITWFVFDGVRDHFGRAFAENFTQLSRQRILAPVSREMALSTRLANSEVTRRWLHNENDPAARELFFREAEGYRRDFMGHAYFIASADSGNCYYSDATGQSDLPRYTLSRDATDDGWFYASLKSPDSYNINVNPDLKIKTTKVWINVQIRDGDQVLGLSGAGLDVGAFCANSSTAAEPGSHLSSLMNKAPYKPTRTPRASPTTRARRGRPRSTARSSACSMQAIAAAISRRPCSRPRRSPTAWP